MNLLWVAQIPTGIVLILSTRERLLKCALVFKKQCALNHLCVYPSCTKKLVPTHSSLALYNDSGI